GADDASKSAANQTPLKLAQMPVRRAASRASSGQVLNPRTPAVHPESPLPDAAAARECAQSILSARTVSPNNHPRHFPIPRLDFPPHRALSTSKSTSCHSTTADASSPARRPCLASSNPAQSHPHHALAPRPAPQCHSSPSPHENPHTPASDAAYSTASDHHPQSKL